MNTKLDYFIAVLVFGAAFIGLSIAMLVIR